MEITELARQQSSCHGARMTGAGFGGCAVALVDASAVDAFSAAVLPAYRKQIDLAQYEMGTPGVLSQMWGSGNDFLPAAYRLFPPAFLLVFGLSVILTFLMPETYASTARIKIERDQTDIEGVAGNPGMA